MLMHNLMTAVLVSFLLLSISSSGYAACPLDDKAVLDALGGASFSNVAGKQKLVPVYETGGKAALSDPKASLKKLSSGKAFKGFKVQSLAEGSLLHQAGFKNDDVLVGVDGKTLKEKDGFAIFNAFRDKETVAAKIQRGGKDETITCPINGRSKKK